MDIGSSTGVQAATSVAGNAMKDTMGAQLISKTLDKLNTGSSFSGAAVNPDYQFQKDVLSASGIGTKLDAIA